MPWAKSQPPSPYYMQVLGSPRPRLRFRPRTSRGRTCPRRRSASSSAAPAAARSPCASSTAAAATRSRSRSRASSATSTAACSRPKAPGCARSCRATSRAAAVRDLPRRPPPPRAAGGQDRRRGHFACRAAAASPTRSPGSPRSTRSSPRPRTRSPRPSSRRSTSASASSTMSGSTISTSTAPAARCRGGESQRIRLASQIGCGLSGVLYVLDEPSIGLHQKDNDRLLETLKRLRGLGNTVLVVEHDEEAIRTADHVIDMGPGAGVHGGEVVCAGTARRPPRLQGQPHRRLSHRPPRDPDARRPAARAAGKYVTVHGATRQQPPERHRRLPARHLHLRHRGQRLAASRRLAIDTLYPAAARALNGARILAGPHDKVTGLEHLDKVIDIDQSPIGRTPRSNPATYTGAFTQIRDWFAGLPESKARGYKPGRFSLQRQGRAVRGVPGRRPHQDRDALPARRLRHLRRVPRRALQPRDARGEVQGPLDRRRARHERRGGGRAVQGGPRDPRQDAHAAGGRARLHQGRPERDHAQRRRGAARQAVARSCRAAPPARPSTSSTSRPPASTSRTSASCSKCSTRWSSRATPWS